MAWVELFRRDSLLNIRRFYVPDEADTNALYQTYRHEGGIRNFCRFVLASIRDQSDEYISFEGDDLGSS